MRKINLPVHITKVDESKREVWGTAAIEEVDQTNEILDYATSKPLFEGWSKNFQAATAGKSFGNLRSMHDAKIAAGKLISFAADDSTKSFQIGAKVVDDKEWKKVTEGVYTGFSIGGSYVKTWNDPDIDGVTRYTAKPGEVSLVDNPCISGATFEFIRSTGASELRKFVQPTRLTDTDVDRIAKAVKKGMDPDCEVTDKKKKKTKSVGGVDLPANAFVLVKDAEDPETWQIPYAVGRDVGTKKFFQGILEEAFSKGLKSAELKKNIWDVGSLASTLVSLCWLRDDLMWDNEYDDNPSMIPEQLSDILVMLKRVFIDLATEGVNELIQEEEEAAKVASQTALQKGAPIVATRINKLKEAIGKADTPEKLTKYAILLDKAADAINSVADNVAKAVEAAGKLAEGEVSEANQPHIDALDEALSNVADTMEEIQAAAQSGEPELVGTAVAGKGFNAQLRKMQRDHTRQMASMTKTFETSMAQTLELVGKALGGDSPEQVAIPAVTRTPEDTVAKRGTPTGSGGIVVVPGINGAVLKSEDGKHVVIKANGMPDAAFVESAEARDGSAFVEKAMKARPEVGNPFPSEQFTL